MAKLLSWKYLPWVLGAAVALVVLAVLLIVGLGGTDRAGDPEESESAPDELPMRFSGKDSRVLGDINVPVDAVIEWTNRPPGGDPKAGFFSVDDQAYVIDLKAPCREDEACSTSGRHPLPKGSYKAVDVGALGTWTMLIRAGPPPRKSTERRPQAKERQAERRKRSNRRERSRSRRRAGRS